ncbi:MAG: hypothetical protein ACKVPX_07280 [Myxococcaceae bacterium]
MAIDTLASVQKVDLVYFLGGFPQIAAALIIAAVLARDGVRRVRRIREDAQAAR